MSDLTDVVETLEQHAPSSALRTRPATLNDLFKKKPRRDVVTLITTDDNGDRLELQLTYEAISSIEYDNLVARHKPTAEQKREGAAYNIDTFAPALIAAVCVEPSMSEDDAKTLYNSDQWSGGEISGLFIGALKVCNAGLDVAFTEGV